MAQDIGVVIIHGMGSQEETFAAPMIDRLTKEVRKRSGDPERIAFAPLYWADVLRIARYCCCRRPRQPRVSISVGCGGS